MSNNMRGYLKFSSFSRAGAAFCLLMILIAPLPAGRELRELIASHWVHRAISGGVVVLFTGMSLMGAIRDKSRKRNATDATEHRKALAAFWSGLLIAVNVAGFGMAVIAESIVPVAVGGTITLAILGVGVMWLLGSARSR